MYWAKEYHIDGFRFDLVGLIDTVTIQQIVDDVHGILFPLLQKDILLNDTFQSRAFHKLSKSKHPLRGFRNALLSNTDANGCFRDKMDLSVSSFGGDLHDRI